MAALRSLLLTNVVAVASAVWLNASKTPAKLTSFGSICGKAEAWTKLTVDPTVSGVQNIQFDKILALNQAQVDDYDSLIETKKEEVAKLEPRIAEALKNEAVPVIDETTMGEFIEKALAPFAGQVKESECGDPKKRVKTVRGAFRKAQDGFPQVVSEFFSSVLFDEELFWASFDEIAGTGKYCTRLRQRLKDAVVKGGMKPVVGGSAALLDQKAKLEAEIASLQEKKAQCKSDMSSIAAFEGTMKEQKKGYNVREDELMQAEEQLEDAIANLDGLEMDLSESEEKLQGVLEKLAEEGEKLADAKTSLKDLQAADQELKAQLSVTTGQLTDVTQKLTTAKKADKVIEELRDAVSVTTLKMRLLFEEAALKPVLESGLSRETNLNQIFFASVNQIPGGNVLPGQVEELTTFCEQEAKPAFAEVKEPDLSPLCPKSDSGEIMDVVTNSMVLRVSQVKKLLTEVQSWFDPYKGQSEFTSDDALDYVEMGEPEGLREIVGVYAQSTFYQYLKGWTVKGKFLPLIAQLKDLMDDLSKALAELQEAAKALNDKSAKMDEALKKAEFSLEAATQAVALPAAEKAALEEEIESLKEAHAKQLKVTGDFEEAVRLALKRVEEAEKSMIESYKEYYEAQALLQKGSATNLAGPGTSHALS